MTLPVQTYSAESRVRDVGSVLREMAQGMRSSRYIAYRLVRRDIKNDYATSAFGMLWDLLDPLVLASIFYLLMRTRIIPSDDLGMPPSVFVVYGMMLYQTFSDSVLLSVNVMTRSRNLLTHLKLPPEALILSVLYRVGFNSAFRIVIMLGFSLLAASFSPVGFAKFLVLFPILILAGMALGIFLAPFNVIYSDVGRLVRIVLVPLRFLSPVIYAIPAASLLGRLQFLNPFTLLLNNLRSLATNNMTTDLLPTAVHLTVLLVVGLAGWFIFHISIPVLAERT